MILNMLLLLLLSYFRKRLPDIIGIGVKKSGTTTLGMAGVRDGDKLMQKLKIQSEVGMQWAYHYGKSCCFYNYLKLLSSRHLPQLPPQHCGEGGRTETFPQSRHRVQEGNPLLHIKNAKGEVCKSRYFTFKCYALDIPERMNWSC